ncbi:Uncharacterised protein [Mycobacteroides abscessus subsp. abscessus]|nr:Uncharacterised protein [Mycobacteroides abscessus subsp. abscessus]SKU06192.1 Uncharacterised protein [Mycobacteroides abscessus subsp. abscessus]
MYTSAQACRSVKSATGPEGPSISAISEVSWTKYPDTKRAASPFCRRMDTSSQAVSRHEPMPTASVVSGLCTPGSNRTAYPTSEQSA